MALTPRGAAGAGNPLAARAKRERGSLSAAHRAPGLGPAACRAIAAVLPV